ncbi:MAG: hypothetical protein WBY44_17625, partial [Bryobacteraceae bacterium]
RGENEMSTPAQIAANQANSKFSTGATTDAGKQTVSKNSLKHGLSSPNPVHVILPGEEDPFAEHLEGYMQAYTPVGVPEQDLVRSLASNNWRLQRCHSMERALFSYLQKEVAEGAETAAETLRELNKTVGYAHKIERAIEKTRNELKSLQSERKGAYSKAQEEAILLTQLAHAKGQPPDQAKEFPSPELCGGFVYSLPEVARLIGRAARLAEANARFEL